MDFESCKELGMEGWHSAERERIISHVVKLAEIEWIYYKVENEF